MLRFWGIILALAVSLAAFALAAADSAPSRWVGAIMLAVLVVVGIGQPVRQLGIVLSLVFSGLYIFSAMALGSAAVTAVFVVASILLPLAVAAAAEMFGRVCTAEDERHLSAAATVEALTPTDPMAGVTKWQHAAPLFEREIARARRIGQSLGFLLVRIEGAEDLDRRLGPDGAAQAIGAVGGYLLRRCRSTDVVLYRGLGQFGVVLPDTSPELAEVVARRIVDNATGALPVALAVGAASFPQDGEDPAALLRAASTEQAPDDPPRQPLEDGPGEVSPGVAEVTQ